MDEDGVCGRKHSSAGKCPDYAKFLDEDGKLNLAAYAAAHPAKSNFLQDLNETAKSQKRSWTSGRSKPPSNSASIVNTDWREY